MEYKLGRSFLLRAPEDAELVSFINEFAEKKGIRVGIFNVIGSLKKAKIGYFDTNERKYQVIELSETHELIATMGNISLKDGKPFAHVHAVLGDEKGNAKGGHLVEGIIFVAEIFIQELIGEPLERKPQESGLALWDEERT